jgi:hypothetical protein
MPRLSKIGAAALAAFGWTGLSIVSATYLQVAGGGGGGGGDFGSGGGAGGGGGALADELTKLDNLASAQYRLGKYAEADSVMRYGVQKEACYKGCKCLKCRFIEALRA